MKRPCLDCGRLARGASRCPACERARGRRREALRPSRHERGYGRDHVRARAALRETLPDLCGYGCGRLLAPDGDWVAAHLVDGEPAAGWIAACRSCNERAKDGGHRESGREGLRYPPANLAHAAAVSLGSGGRTP